MDLAVKALVIILIIQCSTAHVLSKSLSEEDSSTTSCVNATRRTEDGLRLKRFVQTYSLKNVSISGLLGLTNLKKANGALDFISLIKKVRTFSTQFLRTITVHNTEDGLLDFTGLAKKYIGMVKAYNVITKDGYILKIFRIPNKSGNVVLITHGILCSSDDFIIRGKSSLVYMLAQKGYDVWVMNFRGNRYSRNHITLNPDIDAEFWSYSMHEFGVYDLSAVIDFALNTTNKEQLSVIGHSEGTSSVFVLTSMMPEYNDKMKVFVALSPVVYLSDSGLAMKALIRVAPIFNEILPFEIQEVLGYQSLERKVFQYLCSHGQVGYELCYNLILAALTGYDPYNLEPEFFLSVLGHFPAGTSRKNIMHFAQVGNSDRFARYDYGAYNKDIYGTRTPPNYDLTKVTCNVTMFVSKNDAILGLKSAERLKKELSNVRGYYVLKYELFSHLDFLYARDAHNILYPQVINMLN